MNDRKTNLIRIGIFYDGYYFYKVSNYYKYEHERKARISIGGLHKFIRKEVAAITRAEERQCQIIDAHYFKGRSSARDLGEKVQSERVFEDILMRENIVTHYLPLRYGENNTLQEKGIDVWLALEAYELAIHKQFDVLVLVACDGDYVPLVRKLNTLGTQVMLISWDFSYRSENGSLAETRTSRQLLEEVLFPVLMHQRIDEGTADDAIKGLFVAERYSEYAPANEYTESIGNLTAPKLRNGAGGGEKADAPYRDGPYPATILSLKTGFGFLSEEKHNNVFFHYSTLTNTDFDDLQVGMNVEYFRVIDEERTQKEGDTRYRAFEVTVCPQSNGA